MGDVWQTNDVRVLAIRVAAVSVACVVSIAAGQALAGKWVSNLVATAIVAYGFGAIFHLWSYFGYEVGTDD